ncbi:MAG: PAS domain-containing protein [Pseudomonadota bacterium]
MTTAKTNPAKGAVAFSVDEIFFSRTDDRGVITAGNEVFQHLSGYDWSELIGAPHKVIRHSDTPKSLFHLVWQRLKAGENVIFYVKNKAKDGRYYWVLAFASPMDGGFVSVRVKPTSKMFEMIAPLYEDLRQEEEEIGWNAEEHGHARLLERLAEEGFDSYDAFASEVSLAEGNARRIELNRMPNPAAENLVAVSKSVETLNGEVAELAEIFQRIRTTPINLGIMANRIERSGGPISAISGIYSSMSAEIGDWLDGFLKKSDEAFVRMQKKTSDCLATLAIAEISQEMLAAFEAETDMEREFNHHDEIFKLKKGARTSARTTRNAISSIRNDAIDMQNAVHVLKRHVMSLSSTRVLCEIESAKLPTRSESLEGVVAQLADFQEEIEELHKRIESGTQSIIACLSTDVLVTETETQEAA